MRHVIAIVLVLFAADGAFAARQSSSRRTSSKRSANNDAVKEDCATQWIGAVDSECYNIANTLDGGVYADCDAKTADELYDIMDMRIGRSMDASKLSAFVKKCSPYKSFALERWLNSKRLVEESAVKGSADCVSATKKLSAAKKCYSAAIAHDGNFFEFESLMRYSCGDQPDVAQRFAKAGDLGFANLPRIVENYTTLQFTNKAPNWRNAVESVLAGYIYAAQGACGDATYDLVEFNRFEPDARGNLLHEAQKGFARQFGAQLGSRAENALMTGRPTAGAPYSPKSVVPYKSPGISSPIVAVDLNPSASARRIGARINAREAYYDESFGVRGGMPSGRDKVSGNVFLIEDVQSLSAARARLGNIVVNGNIGGEGYRDGLDLAVIMALGGRRGSPSGEVMELLDNVSDGDVFVLTSAGSCQLLKVEGGALRIMSRLEVDGTALVRGRLTRCVEIIE
ncbi:MAG: hypothetical protein LBH41_01415 [Rickettsiales bacterium]|jgi:hypothetical protein|nr:hypothetical protein [Rickettsiales bacterium]